MLFASIDIGTNAARLLFANVFQRNGKAVAEKASLIRIPLRLGDDVFSLNYISEKKKEDLLNTMRAYKLLIDVYRPVAYHAVATAAMRESTNAEEIVNLIKKETGIEINVISGQREAELVSASDNIIPGEKFTHKMYIDVGGGSTEITVIKDKKIIKSKSFKIGTIRILNDKVHEEEWDKMKEWLKEFKNDYGRIFLVGSGGNINKIAKGYGHTENQMVFFHEIQHAYSHLSHYSLEERIEKLGLRPDRADVIVPAGKIFIHIMKTIKAEAIYVPRIGLADGVIYDAFKKYCAEQNNAHCNG